MSEKVQPKYAQLKQEILTWIREGRLRADERMPSEHDIAGRYGMSRQTVRQALGELERDGWLYRRQGKGTFVASARPEGQRETPAIGMLTTYISDYIFPHIVRGAEAALRDRGYGLLLSSTDNDKAKETVNLRHLLGQPVGGLIIEPTKSAQGNPNLSEYLALQARGIPFLMINERYPDVHCPCVKVDDEAGGFAAAEHLIGLGHRRIAGFFKTDDLQGAGRLKGFLRAHRHYGVPIRPDAIVHYGTEEKRTKPVDAAAALLRREERPTAMVCYNDELAVLLLDAIRQAGLTVPDDLSIVGFDDSGLATATEVKLTSLTHPKQEMGRVAAELLLGMIGDRSGVLPADVVFQPSLVVRESTGRPATVPS